MTTGISPGITLTQKIFYNVVWTPMIKSGEVWLAGIEAPIPVLNLPIILGLEDDIIQSLTDSLFNMLVLTFDVTTISLLNPARQSAYSSASEALRLIAIEQGENSDAFKQAQDAAIAAQIKLTSFIGA